MQPVPEPSSERNQRLAGRHVLVTGAGTGIGMAIARRLSDEGALLCLAARDLPRLEAVVQALPAGQSQAMALDITQRDATHAAVQAAAESFGPFYAVVANSGIGGPNEPGPKDRFDELVATNLTGTYNTLRAAQEFMLPQATGRRHMLAIASILGRIGVAGYTGYCASKAGIGGLVRALAMELAPDEIQVNAIAPGWVNTAMAREGIDGMAQGMGVTAKEALSVAMQSVPMGCMGEPSDVAGLVAYLLSEDARGMTGQCVDMNGGAWM